MAATKPKSPRGGPHLASDEMWDLIRKDFVLGGTIGSGRDDTIIQRALAKSNDKEVCLKIIPVVNSRKREESLREGQMLAACKSGHVIDYLGCYESRAEVVLVTELCHGGDLLDKVNAHGRFSEEESRLMFKQVVKGLRYIHAINIAHRDIKLDNLFECQDGSIKVADFGFATRYKKGELFTTSCGTLSYAAPELLRPRGQVFCKPEAADIWSAGIVLYALNVGRLPFQADDDLVLASLIKKGDLYMPPDLSASLRDLLTRMLAPNPDDRPSFTEVELHKWVTFGVSPPIHRKSMSETPSKRPASPSVPPTYSSGKCAKTGHKGSFLDKHVFKPLKGLLV